MHHTAPRHSYATFILWGCIALVFLILAVKSFASFLQNLPPLLADDAYYYFVVAKNLVGTGSSTFDGLTATNGYHPLWLAVLYLQYLLFSQSLEVSVLIELVCLCAGLYFILKSVGEENFWYYPIFSVGYIVSVSYAAPNGMETSLLFGLFGLTVHTVCRNREHRGSWLAPALFGALAIGARLDAAFFVLPLVVLGLKNRTDKAKAAMLIAACGIVYVLINRIFFGVSLPISGSIKSLGGLQLNTALITDLAQTWRDPTPTLLIRNFLRDPVLQQVLLFLIAPALMLISKRWSIAWVLVAAYAIGFFFYAGKQLFFSSWRLWHWYYYPLTFGMTAVFFVLTDVGRGTLLFRRAEKLAAVAGLVILVALVGRGFLNIYATPTRFDRLNAMAVQQLAELGIRTQTVAMGDRAGSFAYVYGGKVFQLEGLMADKEYFNAIAGHESIKNILCKHNVSFIVDYEVDLGEYSDHTIKVFRPSLSSFDGPAIQVSRNDQVARIYDLTIYDNSKDDEGDNYIYVWRLTGCPPT